MRLQPIVYTTRMDDAIAWYSAILGSTPEYASDSWTSFAVRGGHLALHAASRLRDGGRTVLSLVAEEPLEELIARLAASGIEPRRGLQDETFGRSVVLEDPEGLLIQVNEHRA